MEAALLERRADPSASGAGIQLAPNATRLLHALGLKEELRACSLAPEAVELRDGASGAVGWRIPLGGGLEKRYGAPYLLCHRGDLLAMLWRRLGPAARLECEVAGIDQTQDGVAAQCADGSAVEGDFLVGADGVDSLVRRQLGLQAAAGGAYTAWRVQGSAQQAAWAPRDAVSVWCGTGRHLVAYHLPGGGRGQGKVNIVAVAEASGGESAAAAFAGGKAEAWLRQLAHLPWRKYGLRERAPLASWSHGRIGLLGDAAHPLLPFLAQGAGMAVEDAHALAGGLRQGDGLSGLDNAARRRRVARLHRAIGRQADMFHRRGLQGRLAWSRAAMLLGRGLGRPLRDMRLGWLYGAAG